FGEVVNLRPVEGREAGGVQRRGCAAGRKEIDAEGLERARQIEKARLVGNGEERPPDPDVVRSHLREYPSSVVALCCSAIAQLAPIGKCRVAALRSPKCHGWGAPTDHCPDP